MTKIKLEHIQQMIRLSDSALKRQSLKTLGQRQFVFSWKENEFLSR